MGDELIINVAHDGARSGSDPEIHYSSPVTILGMGSRKADSVSLNADIERRLGSPVRNGRNSHSMSHRTGEKSSTLQSTRSYKKQSQDSFYVSAEQRVDRAAILRARAGRLSYGALSDISHCQISDCAGDAEIIATGYFLRRCQKFILKPYSIILQLIGWRRFKKDSPSSFRVLWSIANVLYPMFIFFCVGTYLYYQAASCPGKMDTVTGTKNELKMANQTGNNFASLVGLSQKQSLMAELKIDSESQKDKQGRQVFDGQLIVEAFNTSETSQCVHRLTMYIVPGLIQLIGYLYGFYTFRICGLDEELYALLEKVYLQSSAFCGEKLMVRRSRLFLAFAITWLLLQFFTQFLYNQGFESEADIIRNAPRIIHDKSVVVLMLLAVLRAMGQSFVAVVQAAVILNYILQCEMIIIYLQGIAQFLREKRLNIQNGMQEMLCARRFIGQLNAHLGTIMALNLICFILLSVTGVCLLLMNENENCAAVAYRFIFVLIWITAYAVPIYQAARVTRSGSRMRRIGTEMRVFGSQTIATMDLDSFLLFLANTTLKAKLFGVVIQPKTLTYSIGSVVIIIYFVIITEQVPSTMFGGLL